MERTIEDIVRAASHDVNTMRARFKAETPIGEIDWTDKDDPIVNIREEINAKLASQVARQRDAIIIGALVPHLGPQIVLESLIGRLRSLKREPTEYDDWELDGKLVLRLWPPEITWESNMVNVTQRFQRFNEQGELVP